MENYFHIKTKTNCIVSINGTKAYNITSEKPLDILAKKNCYVSLLPNNDEFLPYTFSLNDIKQNENILIVTHPNHTEIYFTPTYKISDENCTTLIDKKYDDIYVSVKNSNCTYINISKLQNTFTRKLPKFLNCKCDFDNNIFIYGALNNDQTYVLIYDPNKDKILLEDIVEIVEKDKSTIRFMKNTQNLAHHGIVYEYDKNSDVIDNYSIYIDKNPHRTDIKEIMPYAFLESIKLKDFSLARSYLYDTFVTNSNLESYFDNIDEIYLNPYSNDIEYTTTSKGLSKTYRFELTENKIKDIEQIL